MRFLPTRTHGIIDYGSVVVLLLLPLLLPGGLAVRAVWVGAAGVLLLVSLCTRYELGIIKLIPMRLHLAFDATIGLVFVVTSMLVPEEPIVVRIILALLAVFVFGVTLITHKRSTTEMSLALEKRHRAHS